MCVNVFCLTVGFSAVYDVSNECRVVFNICKPLHFSILLPPGCSFDAIFYHAQPRASLAQYQFRVELVLLEQVE